ncbi:MAG: tRNA epoxyqueuosine(34) reductase QueG [Candidatus Acidiferrales bacterium]
MHHSVMLDAAITARLAEQARAIGFDLCGVARAENDDEPGHLPEWLARGYAGEMRYLHDARRHSISGVMPGARSIIVCAINYNTPLPYSTAAVANQSRDGAAESTFSAPRAWISRYAWGDDYHDVLKSKLEQLGSWLRAELHQDFQSRVYVDTGPVLERVAAKQAGLGWLAKNTCLINQQLGSWLFLGVILTDLDLAPTLVDRHAPPPNLCGTCTRCIDACPTDAFVAPYVLDARRCISYLTIELRGAIPEEFRPAMGSMVFGCDICQDVCPWNRKSPATPLTEFLPSKIAAGTPGPVNAAVPAEDPSLFMPALEWLVSLTEDDFRRVFRASPVKRTKWRGLLRNACVAIGNSRITCEHRSYRHIVSRLEELSRSDDAILAEHASWALTRLRATPAAQISRDSESCGAIQGTNPVLSAQPKTFTNHTEEK